MSAWIEIPVDLLWEQIQIQVALYMSAWIEIVFYRNAA